VKKSTERKRIKRLMFDSRMLFLRGLISADGMKKIQTTVLAAEKKL